MSECTSKRHLSEANAMLSREARLEDMHTLAGVLAERDRLRAVVQRVEGLAVALAGAADRFRVRCRESRDLYGEGATDSLDTAVRRLRDALGSTDTRPTPAGAHDAEPCSAMARQRPTTPQKEGRSA